MLFEPGSPAQTKAVSAAGLRSDTAAALCAAALGFALLFVAGFAEISVLHSATHDTRHATGFPCH